MPYARSTICQRRRERRRARERASKELKELFKEVNNAPLSSLLKVLEDLIDECLLKRYLIH